MQRSLSYFFLLFFVFISTVWSDKSLEECGQLPLFWIIYNFYFTLMGFCSNYPLAINASRLPISGYCLWHHQVFGHGLSTICILHKGTVRPGCPVGACSSCDAAYKSAKNQAISQTWKRPRDFRLEWSWLFHRQLGLGQVMLTREEMAGLQKDLRSRESLGMEVTRAKRRCGKKHSELRGP